jgi:macrolide-specific efflux system membrane fusion protein
MPGSIRLTVQATGSVQPLNKVSILPPVGGRIDKIIALEGRAVRKGQVLAWMSSSERAVLLDNAQAKGPEEVKYWEGAYAPTPIIAPVDGIVIARNVVEGQTVSLGTDLYDLSDRLIVQAAVDETDLGKIHDEQKASVTVDAYPDKPFNADVNLISHQAVKVNNVVTYYVQLEPRKVPGTLRAGMTANVDFILEEREHVLLIPAWAVKGMERTTVMLKVATAAPVAGKPADKAAPGGEGPQGKKGKHGKQGGWGGGGGVGQAGGWSGHRRDGGDRDAAAAAPGQDAPPVTLKDAGKPRPVRLGVSDGSSVEVLDGLHEGDIVIVESLRLPDAAGGSLFGAPARPQGGGNRGGGGGGGRAGR